MISSIAWVPAGVADPNPQKYEASAAEQEILQAMMEQEQQQEQQGNKDNKKKKKGRGEMKVSMPPAAAAATAALLSSLPADLRMDEYSDDDDEAAASLALGARLVGQPMEENENEESDNQDDDEDDDDDSKEDEEAKKSHNDNDDNDDSDSDNDDDENFADIPDTREFEPVDVQGLQAMGLGHVTHAEGGFGGNQDDDDGDVDDDEDLEDVRLTDTDAIVLVAKTEEDFASLEVQVYDQKTGNIYVHHDIPLPAFPICVAHGQVTSGGVVGNFCAVGTFEPGIEIWNLDVINALEPSCILGGDDTSAADEWMKQQMMMSGNGGGASLSSSGADNGGKMARKRQEQTGLRPGSHTDAVMALSWNTIHGQVIASGSADHTVKLWDVTQAGMDYSGKCNATTFTHHRDKVSSVVWHPREGTLLATGSHDRTVALLDARTNGENARSVKIPADCEVVAWDPFHSELLTVASEDGTISCWDVRKFETKSPLWTLASDEFGGVSDLAFNAHVPGLMATCSVDKRVTLWDSHHDGALSSTPPRPCGSKDMCAGKLYTVKFYPSEPWLLACGGTGNQLSIWHIDSEEAVLRRFGNRLGQADEHYGKRGQGSESAGGSKKEDFEAMMASKEQPSNDGQGESTKRKGNNKKKKEKRKAHRRGG